jgi:hypothetical protein
MKLGYQVQLQFAITQHIRDLMFSIKEFFNCGHIGNDGPTKLQFRIRSLLELESRLFPLLDMYPLQTLKRLDAEAFREVHAMMKNGLHLTLKGFEEIQKIRATTNRGRMLQ